MEKSGLCGDPHRGNAVGLLAWYWSRWPDAPRAGVPEETALRLLRHDLWLWPVVPVSQIQGAATPTAQGLRVQRRLQVYEVRKIRLLQGLRPNAATGPTPVQRRLRQAQVLPETQAVRPAAEATARETEVLQV